MPGAPAVVRATNPWTLGVSPSALTEGVAADVSLSVTDGSEMIGCVTVDVPAGFAVLGARVSSVPAGSVWGAEITGSGPARVTFSTTIDAWRLNGGEQAVFVVRVVATSSPLPAWTFRAFKKFSVDSTQLDGGPLVVPGPFQIGAPTPSPSPSPSPEPTPTATPTTSGAPVATAAPTPRPSVMPSASHSSPPSGASSRPVATAIPSGSATPSSSADASPASGVGAGPVAGTTAAGSAGFPGVAAAGDETTLDIGGLPAGGTVQLDSQAVGGIGMFAWLVPGLFLSLPGLLLLLIVAAQAGFATGFVPVTRRILGFGRRRRPHGPVPSH